MRVTKVTVSEDKKDVWLTIKTNDDDEYCVVHIQGERFGSWQLSGGNLDIKMAGLGE